jgi:pimeloyl-ACP methyl ester carboxylesterase
VSTPTSLELPDGVRRTTIDTARGAFAALEAVPGSGVCERDAALLVPGYTGSKEDFLAILHLLADNSRHVIAIDMRGQFETACAEDPAGYAAAALGADILAIMHETGARHLVGHSYGGLVGREAVLAGTGAEFGSFTLMSSGPGALTGPRAKDLQAMLGALGVEDGGRTDGRRPEAGLPEAGLPEPGLPEPGLPEPGRPEAGLPEPGLPEAGLPEAGRPDKAVLRAGIADLWRTHLEPQAIAAGVPGHIVAFLGRRMLANDPDGLVLMAAHMLNAPDRTAELARLDQLPMLVIYGENDNSWSPAEQETMAGRLRARRLCIPAAVHSPAVEAPATTASALSEFWDAAEAAQTRSAATTGRGAR